MELLRTAPRPVITLTTDFGVSDHYVGSMKGVLLTRCPDAQIVDISHAITPFSIWEGAYTVGQAAAFYPPKTVHVVVVDPGVGTERLAIVAEALGQVFVAPDNGVLSFVLRGDPQARAWAVRDRTLFLPSVSATFHGRDLFAPVAAALATGAKRPEQVGEAAEPVSLSGLEPVQTASGFRGRILSVDRFGNVITNIPAARFRDLRIQAGREEIVQVCRTFGEAEPGALFLYGGSSGFWEIGINQGKAAGRLQMRPGDPIQFTAGTVSL